MKIARFLFLPLLSAVAIVCWLFLRAGTPYLKSIPSLPPTDAEVLGWTCAAYFAPLVVLALGWRVARWRVRGIGIAMVLGFLLAGGRETAYLLLTRVDERVVAEADGSLEAEMRLGRAWMATPPEEAAARAVRRGDRRLLAVAGITVIAPGIDGPEWIAPHHQRVFPGTSDLITSREHDAYNGDAMCYALRYNVALLERTGRAARVERDPRSWSAEIARRCAEETRMRAER